jgi:hypothetical protein
MSVSVELYYVTISRPLKFNQSVFFLNLFNQPIQVYYSGQQWVFRPVVILIPLQNFKSVKNLIKKRPIKNEYSCLVNMPNPLTNPYQIAGAGAIWSADDQCKQYYGMNAALCRSVSIESFLLKEKIN